MPQRNDMAEGLQAGAELARTINGSIDASDDRDARKQQLADQLALEQQLEQMRESSASSLEDKRLAGETALASQSQDSEDVRQKALFAWNAQHDQDMAAMQEKLETDRAARGSHALSDQFNAYQDTLDQLAEGAKAAQASGNPDAVASANRRLATWQQMGPGIFDTAKKDQGIDVSYEPTGPDGRPTGLKISGKVPDLKSALALKNQVAPAPTDGMSGALDDAIKAKQLDLTNAVSADPTNAHTWGDFLGMGGRSAISKAQTDLQALQAQRAQLAPSAVAPDTSAAFDPTQGQLAPSPAPVQQLSPAAVNPAQTGAAAAQAVNGGGGIPEGQTATNPKTGQQLIYKGGAWQPLTQ